MKLKLILPIVLLSSLSLISCGGGGGGDVTQTAVIDSTNEESLAIAATEALKQAVQGKSIPSYSPVSSKPAARVDYSLTSDYSTFLCPDGGSAVLVIDENSGNGSYTFTECSSYGSILNGAISWTVTQSGNSVTINTSSSNFTSTYGLETVSFDYSSTCTIADIQDPNTTVSCTYHSDALGIDGRTYIVSTSSIEGDEFIGYSVNATVTDPDHGNIFITTNSAVKFDCDNGQPGSGEIQFTDGDNNTVIVTYDSCSSFTVSYNGTSNPYTW